MKNKSGFKSQKNQKILFDRIAFDSQALGVHMQADTAPQDPEPSDHQNTTTDQEGVPVVLMRTLGWVFLAPACAALAYGLLGVFVGVSTSTAMLFSAFFALVLLFSPEKQHLDWYGLCFATAAVGLLFIGHPVAFILGCLAGLFCILTLFDESSGLALKEKIVLFGLFLINAGLTSVVYLLPKWSAVGLSMLYLFFYLSVRLLPLGLMARASLLEDDE